MQFYILTTLCT